MAEEFSPMMQNHPRGAPRDTSTSARILVLGVGGAGSNAVDRLIQSGAVGVEFVALNTDQQALGQSLAPKRILLGDRLAHGLGAGGNPAVGAKAAEECSAHIARVCEGADMVFIAAGMGKGTGTGASPVIAKIAQESGALTVGVVTTPFAFEGSLRKRNADAGIAQLRQELNTLILIPNDRVLTVIDRRTTLVDALAVIDDVLRQGIQGISELITRPGLINLDFADVRTVMSEPGIALMAIGRAAGGDRAVVAAQAAVSSPLLDLSMHGARGVLFNITGSNDLKLTEIDQAAEVIRSAADPDANIIFGAVIDEALSDEVKITVIATGFDPRDSGRSEESGREGPKRPDRSGPGIQGSRLRAEDFDLPPALRQPRGSRPSDDPMPEPPDWLRGRGSGSRLFGPNDR
jgi:cell division protein FtsZ